MVENGIFRKTSINQYHRIVLCSNFQTITILVRLIYCVNIFNRICSFVDLLEKNDEILTYFGPWLQIKDAEPNAVNTTISFRRVLRIMWEKNLSGIVKNEKDIESFLTYMKMNWFMTLLPPLLPREIFYHITACRENNFNGHYVCFCCA